MAKILFKPFGILGGVVAGAVATRVFQRLWRLIDDEQAPGPDHLEVSLPKLALALMLEGAVFHAVRGLFDRGSRIAFSRATGRWPGQTASEQSQE
jgi:hypothetical protein